jgi:hypothetical protein
MKTEILRMVWKVLRPFVEGMLKELLKVAIDRVARFVGELQRERTEQAQSKAAAASAARKEQVDSDPIEAARQAGKEEVWREIAGHYKRDAEVLRAELAQIRAALEKTGVAKLNDVESHEIPRLASDGKSWRKKDDRL